MRKKFSILAGVLFTMPMCVAVSMLMGWWRLMKLFMVLDILWGVTQLCALIIVRLSEGRDEENE